MTEYLSFSLKPPAFPKCFHYINLSWQFERSELQKQHRTVWILTLMLTNHFNHKFIYYVYKINDYQLSLRAK